MLKPKYALLFGLLLFFLLDSISGRKTGSHSYPRSGGLSGSGHRSGGLSGGGHGYPSSGSHGYPSGGLSGGGSGYPSSGGNRGYPSSSGSHTYPSSGNSGYPSSGGSHTYPSSGNKQHSYPSSGGGLSGTGRGNAANKPTQHTTNIHNNYHYSPPAQITYASPRGGPPVSYPVYRGTPPTYVYQYKDSGSKYGTLLAGLALMNLGTLGVAAYAAHQANSNSNHGSSSYKPQPGEICKFAVKKENGDYEETKIDCQIISGFVLQDMQTHSSGNNSTITTVTTVTNTTIVNNTNVVPSETTTTPPAPNILYQMLPNGTLVPVNVTGVNIPGAVVNVTQNATAPAAPNGPVSTSVVTTTTTNTTQLVSALDVKGKPVEVTPGMQCFVIRTTSISKMRKEIPCGVLQTYAEKSIRKNSASRNMPIMFTVITAVVAYCIS